MRIYTLSFLSLLAVAAAPARAQSTDPLTFEQRVAAHQRLERSRYAHQIGATRPFEQALPPAAIEEKVRRMLGQAEALENRWGVTMNARHLSGELRRIAASTKVPGRLREMFQTLDEDSFLIQEVLVRPLLVERWFEDRFSQDPEIHADARREAERLRQALADGTLDPGVDHPRRTRGTVPRETIDGLLHPGVPGSVEERARDFCVRVVLEVGADDVKVADYTVPKVARETWWTLEGPTYEAREVRSIADPSVPLPRVLGSSACLDDDTWDLGLRSAVPGPRLNTTSVWTGNLLLVWGGNTGGMLGMFEGFQGGGGRYDPVTDTWVVLSDYQAPSGRAGHTAVWTGSEMIVWGGYSGLSPFYTEWSNGGRYDPVLDRWTPTSTSSPPQERRFHLAIWTGTEMAIWGGRRTRFGTPAADQKLYNPVTDTWRTMAAPGRAMESSNHSAVWTGSRIAVFGAVPGLLYDPGTDAWTAMTAVNQPVARTGSTAVWTGSRAIFWGGQLRDDGGQYDPQSDSWTPVATVGAPAGRSAHVAVSTDSRMIVWGGILSGNVRTDSGAIYDPALGTWTPTSTVGAATPRITPAAVWTGSEMVVWAGDDGNRNANGFGTCDTGARYDPAENSWAPTGRPVAPARADDPVLLWTGTHVLHYGGTADDGARYDPVSDTWTYLPGLGAPPRTFKSLGVWTGAEMLVYGTSGGRYDPQADVWTPMSALDAPPSRSDGTAVWTGQEMIVWGGQISSGLTNTGSRYDPSLDQWTAVSVANAPVARREHSALWTGTEMIVWGGNTSAGSTATGARYDPAQNAWQPVSPTAAPSARRRHTAVWTGSEMIVWGGQGSPSDPPTGARYLPATDSWMATSMTDVPQNRHSHSAVWTGSRMIVWGGANETGAGAVNLRTGGRYDPVGNTWGPTKLEGSPSTRSNHSAVWTGSHMLIWGAGEVGGRYVWGHQVDDDGDGFTECQGDCNDGNDELWAAPGEARSLMFLDGITLSWTAPGTPGSDPSLLHHETLRSATPADWSAPQCLALSGSTTTVDPELPPEGTVFHYLVRAENPCTVGEGNLGVSSTGQPRAGGACP